MRRAVNFKDAFVLLLFLLATPLFAGPDLTITKTDSVAGATTLGNNWTWTLTVVNGGTAAAVFAAGQTILTDNLPNTNIIYGGKTISVTGILSGTITCPGVNDFSCTTPSGFSIGPGATLSVSFTATPTAAGVFANPRAAGVCAVDPNNNVAEDEGRETNNSCSDSVNVTAAPDVSASLVGYMSNLNLGDSFVNITNAGTLGAGLASGTTASLTGAICANVFVFSPDEQMISCCSCPVTPNGLVSLSGQQDLISNTLTPAVPSSIIIKLVATVPVAGTCNLAAANISQAGLAPGMVAWGTRLHTPQVGSATPQMTEVPFLPDTLSAGELARLQGLCTFIQAYGSTFGVCRSCRLGALGAGRK